MRALDGKTALVTGAAGAIGGAVAQAFAEAGAQVPAVDRTEATVGDAFCRRRDPARRALPDAFLREGERLDHRGCVLRAGERLTLPAGA